MDDNMADNMADNIAIWTITWPITWTITCYSSANSKEEYTAAQSQSIQKSRRPIRGLCCFCREVVEFGRQDIWMLCDWAAVYSPLLLAVHHT